MKVQLATKFNTLVYGDLVYIDVGQQTLIFLVIIDDAIRFAKVGFVQYKDFSSLVSAVKLHWVSNFGPPRRWRSDKESAFAHDSYGVWCESAGITRELVKADEQHTKLGPIDRKIRIIRILTPKIIDSWAEDNNLIAGDDNLILQSLV